MDGHSGRQSLYISPDQPAFQYHSTVATDQSFLASDFLSSTLYPLAEHLCSAPTSQDAAVIVVCLLTKYVPCRKVVAGHMRCYHRTRICSGMFCKGRSAMQLHL